MPGFQTSVSRNQAFAVPGTLLVTYPYTSVAALDGELLAGSAGVTMARFAWAHNTTGFVSNGKPNQLLSARCGIVTRSSGVASITDYLGEASMLIAPGREVTLYDSGHAIIACPASGAAPGQKVFASYFDGSFTVGTAGTPTTSTLSVTTTNGSATISFTGGNLAPGMPITGTGIPASSFVGTVNAGAGTATLVNAAGAAANATASATVTATISAYETRFFVKTGGVSGEAIIISDKGF